VVENDILFILLKIKMKKKRGWGVGQERILGEGPSGSKRKRQL
jgi:hypothetical protein